MYREDKICFTNKIGLQPTAAMEEFSTIAHFPRITIGWEIFSAEAFLWPAVFYAELG